MTWRRGISDGKGRRRKGKGVLKHRCQPRGPPELGMRETADDMRTGAKLPICVLLAAKSRTAEWYGCAHKPADRGELGLVHFQSMQMVMQTSQGCSVGIFELSLCMTAGLVFERHWRATYKHDVRSVQKLTTAKKKRYRLRVQPSLELSQWLWNQIDASDEFLSLHQPCATALSPWGSLSLQPFRPPSCAWELRPHGTPPWSHWACAPLRWPPVKSSNQTVITQPGESESGLRFQLNASK